MKLINHFNIISIIFFSVFFSSCHSLVDDEFTNFNRVPVINAILQTDSTLYIQVSFTTNLNDSVPPPVKNALVIIESSSNVPDTLAYTKDGWYSSNQQVKSGITYTCKVEIPGFLPIFATTYVPLPTNIENVVFTEVASRGEEGEIISSLQFDINNDTSKNLFWEVKLADIGVFRTYDFEKRKYIEYFGSDYQSIFFIAGQDAILLNEAAPLSIFSNEKMKSDTYRISLYYSENYVQFSSDDSIYIVVRSVDESYYKYQKQLYLYQTAGNSNLGSSPQTYPLYSNISNGLGLFTSYSVANKRIEF